MILSIAKQRYPPEGAVEAFQGATCGEADALFSAGRVSGKHLTKLFKPNEIVVTNGDGAQKCLQVEHCVYSVFSDLQLDCSS